MSSLPQILVIDDLLGGPGKEQLRRQFCESLALRDVGEAQSGTSPVSGLLGIVHFESAQEYRADGRRTNSLERAIKAVQAGWPFDDGSRWALVCLDLEFDLGTIKDARLSDFGVEILEGIATQWPDEVRGGGSEVPVIMLSGYTPEVVEKRTRRETPVAFVQKWKPKDGDARRRDLAKVLFERGLVEDGSLPWLAQNGRVSVIERQRPMLGRSLKLLRALRDARLALLRGRDARVLLTAERGAGKELLARYLHDHRIAAASYCPNCRMNVQGAGEFVQVNLQEVPETLIASTLKGHVRGAFTGATGDEEGRIADARHGTLHLDEIGNLRRETLEMLLRLVENDQYDRVGPLRRGGNVAGAMRTIQCQMVLTTNKPIEERVGKDEFPPDLYDRLDKITLPRLNERSGDIRYLFNHFVQEQVQLMGCREKRIAAGAFRRIESESWPGNIRTLRSVAERLVVEKEYSGNIYESDVARAMSRTGASLQRHWAGGYAELLEAVKEYKFTERKELDAAWPKLQAAVGALVSNMFEAAITQFPRKRKKRSASVNLVLGITPEKDNSTECRRWLHNMKKQFGADGEAIQTLLKREAGEKPTD